MNHQECLDAYVRYMAAWGVEAFATVAPDHDCVWFHEGFQRCRLHEGMVWGHPTDAQFETWRSGGHVAEHVVL